MSIETEKILQNIYNNRDKVHLNWRNINKHYEGYSLKIINEIIYKSFFTLTSLF